MELLKDFLYYVVLGIAMLSILVTIHELGHFLPARWFGMRVDKFYLFFDWPRKLFSFKRGVTEYGVGMLPLGGYVKIAGIIDESMDKEHIKQPPQPWEFRSKPVWQRIIVMVGGVTMNILLGIAIFIAIKFIWGEQRLPLAEMKHGILVGKGSMAEELGFKTNDKILNVNGNQVLYLDELNSPNLFVGSDIVVNVERQGKTEAIHIPNNFINRLSEAGSQNPVFAVNPPAKVLFSNDIPYKDMAGYKAGLRDGDVIVGIDSLPVSSFGDIVALLPTKKGQTIDLIVDRNGEKLTLKPTLDSTGKLGFGPDMSGFKTETVSYGFFGAITAGTSAAFSSLITNMKGFGKIFSGDADLSKSVQGPIKIFKILGDQSKGAGWIAFLSITAILSMWLAFINILPIPALDGGHLVFLLIEAVTGREPSLKVRMIAQQIGMVLLLGLMVAILFNDIFN